MAQHRKDNKLYRQNNEGMFVRAGLAARCSLSRILSGLHLAESVLAAGTQRSREPALLHARLARDHGVTDLGTVDTGTVGQARRQHLAGAGFGSNDFGGGGGAFGEFSRYLSARNL
jgi:hypothetical protein